MSKQYVKNDWLNLAKLIWPQGDNFYADRTSSGKWRIGYTNDYPMQHGDGKHLVLPDNFLAAIDARPVFLPLQDEEELKGKIKEILNANLKYVPQIGDIVSFGCVDELYKLITFQPTPTVTTQGEGESRINKLVYEADVVASQLQDRLTGIEGKMILRIRSFLEDALKSMATPASLPAAGGPGETTNNLK